MGCKKAFKKVARKIKEEVTPHLAKHAGVAVKILEGAIIEGALFKDEARKIAIASIKTEAKTAGRGISTVAAGVLVDMAHDWVNKESQPIEMLEVDDSDREDDVL
jgi:hypothetical protein